MIAYNFAIVSFPDKDGMLTIDVYFFNKDSEKLSCVRIDTIYTSFLVHRIPGWTLRQTQMFVEEVAGRNNDFRFETVTNLKDSCYNILDPSNIVSQKFEGMEKLPTYHASSYVKISSRYPNALHTLQMKLTKELEKRYREINPDRLSPVDRVIFNNTETPFRDTLHTTRTRDACYWFSRKFNIPFVGFCIIHTEKLREYTGSYMRPLPSKVDKVYYLSANDIGKDDNANIGSIFEEFTDSSYVPTETNNITIAAYDIETYNKNEKPDYKSPHQYIFCIGVGFFKLNSNKPYARYSIISKDLANDVEIKDRLIEVDDWFPTIVQNHSGIKVYQVRSEYSAKPRNADEPEYSPQPDDDASDVSTYICVNSEMHVVDVFVDLLTEYTPHIITGFNNFTFDDPWIYSRVSRNSGMLERYLQVFSTYSMADLKNDDKILSPEWKKFSMKMEGKTNTDDLFTVRAPIIQTMDVMKLLQKADAKRFSQKWGLNYMLETYHIKNPFNGKPLSKTGLTIAEMFDNWDAGTKLYETAFYCLQDSWICGTLLIERSNIIDKLATSTITYTTFQDSIYRADGHRVSCLNSRYSVTYDFAYMDEAYSKRVEMIDHNWEKSESEKITGLGAKTFDDRVVIGGAVRNVHSRRCTGIVAADFSSMYPSQYRSGNIASSTRVDPYILEHLDEFGLELADKRVINDEYGERSVYYLRYKRDSK